MALFRFHAILVGCAVLFCLGFAAYEGFAYRHGGAGANLYLALFFASAGLALAGYLCWFVRRRLRR